MYDEEQIVKVKWNNNNQEWFESRGYTGYERYKEFSVKVKDLSESSKIKINVICDYCGEAFQSCYSTVRHGEKVFPKHACPHCAGKKASESSRQKRIEKAFTQMRSVCDHYGYTLITTEDDYIDAHMYVDFICPKHGMQTMPMDNIKAGRRCKRCSYESLAEALRLNKEVVEKEINSTNNSKWLNKDDYKTCRECNLIIQCDCGNTFTTSFYNFSRYGINRCHKCANSESSGELRIRKYLEEHYINYIPQYRFADCRDNKPLPFDFYLPDLNKCIEFDGMYHYKDVRFEGQQKYFAGHDDIKTNYCKDHEIDLIRIPYWETKNIEKILDNKLAV